MAIPQRVIDRMIDGQLSDDEIRRFNSRDYGRCEQCGEDMTRHVTECLPLRRRVW